MTPAERHRLGHDHRHRHQLPRRSCARTPRQPTASTLTANPAAGSSLAGWSGACTGRGSAPDDVADEDIWGTSTAAGGPGAHHATAPERHRRLGSTPWTNCCLATSPGTPQRQRHPAQGSIPSELYLMAGRGRTRPTEVALSNATLSGTPTAPAGPGSTWTPHPTRPSASTCSGVARSGGPRAPSRARAIHQWRSITVTPPNQAAVDDLRIRLTMSHLVPPAPRRRLRHLLRAGYGGRPAAQRTLTVTPRAAPARARSPPPASAAPAIAPRPTPTAPRSRSPPTPPPAPASPAGGRLHRHRALRPDDERQQDGLGRLQHPGLPTQRTLTVTPPRGTGSGTITATGISCPGDCTQTYSDGTAVTLTANPAAGSSFAGWRAIAPAPGPAT